MKNLFIKSQFLLVLGLLAFASCTDLDLEEKDSIVVPTSDEGFVAGDPTALLEAAYNDLSTFTDQANVYSLFDHSSDEMIPPTRGVDWGDNGVWRLLHTHNWDATHAYVLGSWNILNQRSFNTNVILASGPSAQQEAEARFLRAFHMWHIMDLYGVVPVREVTDGVDVNPSVMSRTEAFDFIVADLEAAISGLPSAGPSNGNVTANKAAAQALLARAYLNRAVYAQPLESAAGPYTFDNADMQRVIDAADAVAAEGYSLNPSFFDVFSAAESNETIFSSVQGSPQNRWNMTLHYSQNPSGWNGFTTLADFYNSFEAGDARRGAESPVASGTDFHGIKLGFLIGEQEDDNDVTVIDSRTNIPLSFTESVPLAGAPTAAGIRAIKYHPSRGDTKYIFLRYADVHLMKAEAMFRMGNSAGALTLVNELRTLRGASSLGSLTEADILAERGRELYWEGIRRTDQVRFGTFTSTWSEKSVTDASRVLYPIPQQALDSNPNLTQNPGY